MLLNDVVLGRTIKLMSGDENLTQVRLSLRKAVREDGWLIQEYM